MTTQQSHTVRKLPDDPRGSPDPAFIAQIRNKFVVEAEIDRVLTRKMHDRANPGYSAISIDELTRGAASLIGSQMGEDFSILNARWLHGGASKLQIAFDLDWRGFDGSGERRLTTMVLRMEPPAAIVETSRLREFEIIQFVRDVVTVPKCYWIDPLGDHLPHPALIYEFSQGVTKPKKTQSGGVSGVGINFGPDLRPHIAEDFVRQLALLHTIDKTKLEKLKHFEPATVGSNTSIIRQVHAWRRIWEEDRLEDIPLVNVIAQWLIDNAPELDHVSVVHGDYRAGNFLFSEEKRKIITILDWELAVLGDRHQDLSWVISEHFGHMAENGKTFLACGLMPVSDFLSRYEALSGLPVDISRLRYFRVFNDFQGVVTMLGTACRVAKHGKTHQDVVVAWLSMLGHVILGNIRETLEEMI